ncbi:MAG: UDP-N-acetylmuramoyl-tripeptide--D-alanyl-D-alanine ligase [Bacteroidota bacterium]
MTDFVKKIYPHFLEHPAISTDSRQVQPGSLFFALKGESFNGNEFAKTALEKGAGFAVVDEEAFAVSDRYLLVPDVLAALQELASFHRMKFSIPVVAITGTNGKTTTKELTHAVLARKYNTLATIGNLNNHIGVPLTLLRLSGETGIALVEMGANHPGEIALLCKIAGPGYGMITNIGKAHLEGFGGYEGVIRAKTELYHYLRETGGSVFLNDMDELLREHAKGIDQITYGASHSGLAATCVTADPYAAVHLRFPGNIETVIHSNLYGGYNGANIMAAATIGHHFGVPPEEIKAAIEGYQPGNNRSQVSKTDHNLLILDAYNANPSSMEAALTAFSATAYPEKTVILGDMLELGKESDDEHNRILELTDKLGFTRIFLVGPIFTRLNTKRGNICFHDSGLAKLWLDHHRIINSTVLIKGSRGIRLERLVEVL